MTLGDKLSKLRKENNYTQEQLANVLGVSRQAISKWESNLAYPETDKLIRISELFHCSLDYLLKDAVERENKDTDPAEESDACTIRIRKIKEKKSRQTIWGMPLGHIGKNAKGFIAIGALSTGCFSVGALATGKYFALGDSARAMIAIGDSQAAGSMFQKVGELSPQDTKVIKETLDSTVPAVLSWAKEIIKMFL